MSSRIGQECNALPNTAEEAGKWDARLRAPECTDADRERFAAWRDADPANREAFERLQSVVALLREQRGRADARALRDEALRVARRRSRRVWPMAAAASVAVCALGIGLWNSGAGESLRGQVVELMASLQGQATYATGIGQRSSFVLPDGSSVELNSRSRIEVRFSNSQRHVQLLEGQALFSVAKHRNVPFAVVAGSKRIVALGTQFDVRLDDRSLQVTLIEGKVRVGAAEPDSSATGVEEFELTPGKQLVAGVSGDARGGSGGSPRVRQIDVSRVMGWREGRIFLDDMQLESAVAEMNKYSALQIRVADTRLVGIRVNGMFKAGAQESFVAALEQYFPVASQRRGVQEIVLVSR